jgi:predicted deacylase
VLERRVETSANPQLAGVRWPVLEVVGAREGPRLSLLAGVHGCEYPAIAAVRRFIAAVDSARLSGSIMAVPVVSPTSFAARSAFVVPEDGRNLNRSFPGDPGGCFTEALADHVFRAFIEPADLLIDLHGGDLSRRSNRS